MGELLTVFPNFSLSSASFLEVSSGVGIPLSAAFYRMASISLRSARNSAAVSPMFNLRAFSFASRIVSFSFATRSLVADKMLKTGIEAPGLRAGVDGLASSRVKEEGSVRSLLFSMVSSCIAVSIGVQLSARP